MLGELPQRDADDTSNDNVLVSTHSSGSSWSGRDGGGGAAGAAPSFPPSGTYAVRGATYARPEGYCLCWDQDLLDTLYFSERETQDSRAALRQQEWEETRRRRNRRRKELQREVLPVVLWSKRPRGGQQPPPPMAKTTAHPLGILQPCIQFLNVDSSHSVRMFTPPFEGGPVSTPLTVFCVAIATEDACFFSGLRTHFELGHLYPVDENDILIERSPVCIAVECHDDSRSNQIRTGTRISSGEGGGTMGGSLAMGRRSPSGLFHSDDSSCDMSYLEAAAGEQGWKCGCPLAGLGDLVDDGEASSQQDHVAERNVQIHRGRLGPGMWHCYVAIFDGENSEIRIDGVAEPITRGSAARLPSSFRAQLDGLTIGSDHTFDTSLCFGQGSDGEGEGAMAELAVFKGHMDVVDLMALEGHLMTKHGIPHPNRPQTEIAADDEFSRLAHGLIVESSDSGNDNNDGRTNHMSKPVPLRYLTRLRGVAWKQTNPVTGEAISVHRIGSKLDNSSSDW
jgi:hypothetical protein